MNEKNMIKIRESLAMPSEMADALQETVTARVRRNEGRRCFSPRACSAGSTGLTAASIPAVTAGYALPPPRCSVSLQSAPPLSPTISIRKNSLRSLWMRICPRKILTVSVRKSPGYARSLTASLSPCSMSAETRHGKSLKPPILLTRMAKR